MYSRAQIRSFSFLNAQQRRRYKALDATLAEQNTIHLPT
jgi:hypothetical protein